ncbi:hypothetical protein KI688_011708 [Linnemannia hyalina]|uniref:C2H2-type domain-containing protein n=1 Tax=Linnemannia hyalina TaxID=64524 RepID=A0A9P7XVI0_9FUNG|nr:hypothetical protein KI688_011708 [Linnemannia hyalina]
MNTPLMHTAPTFHDVTSMFTPLSLSHPLSASSMMEYTSAMFPENNLSSPTPSIEHTLIAPELRSMSHFHEVEHSLQSYAPTNPVTTTDHSSPSSPFLHELHLASPEHHHHQYHHHHHHPPYQPTSAFQDLGEAQHLSMLQDMMHQSSGAASSSSSDVLTSAACAFHTTMRRTQSLESFSPVTRHMNMTLSMANAMVADDYQPGSPYVGACMPMESKLVEGYSADYTGLLHQDTFQMPPTSMAFADDQFGSSLPSAASSTLPYIFQPLFTPAFSAGSSCYSPAISTSSPSIDNMSITIDDSGRTTPATPYINHNTYYKSDYDSDIDDISCNQNHNQTSNHSRQSSLEPSADVFSDTDTPNDPSNSDDCGEDDDGTSGSGKTFTCYFPDCNRSFGRSYNLKAHALTHGDHRPFPCRLCRKKFARIHDRDRHMSVHSDEKAHCCIVCLGRFARQDAVIRHLKLSNEMNPCSWILKSQGITFRDVAAGRINRRSLGTDEDIVKAVEALENEVRKGKAARALERMNIPKARSK